MKKYLIYIGILILNNSCSSQESARRNLDIYSYNPNLIKSAIDSLESIEYVNCLLIYKAHRLISDTYFNGYSENSIVNLKSASKSILSSLIGIAINKGYIKNIDQTLNEFIPEYFPDTLKDWRKEIKIKDLLTMSSGFETTSGANYVDWVSSENWIEYILERRKISEPGELFHYSTGDTHLLSLVLTKATKMSVFDFAQRYLFDKMEIKIIDWEVDPQGIYLGGNNLFLTPLDMGKFGLLYQNDGVFNNKQLVPKDWVTESTTKHSETNFNIDWNINDSIRSFVDFKGYGYLWWILKLGKYNAKCALGYGGQYIIIIDELDLVLIVIQDWEAPDINREIKVFEILSKHIIPTFEVNNN